MTAPNAPAAPLDDARLEELRYAASVASDYPATAAIKELIAEVDRLRAEREPLLRRVGAAEGKLDGARDRYALAEKAAYMADERWSRLESLLRAGWRVGQPTDIPRTAGRYLLQRDDQRIERSSLAEAVQAAPEPVDPAATPRDKDTP
jgi:hypothetical protein